MADSREVYSWPELTLYCFTGTSSAIMAYAESVDLSVSRSLTKFLYPTTGVGYAARSQFVETNKTVALTIGKLYAGVSLYGMLQSGVNISATVNLSAPADGASSTLIIWSAQHSDFNLQGGEGAVFKEKVKLMAPDISGI